MRTLPLACPCSRDLTNAVPLRVQQPILDCAANHCTHSPSAFLSWHTPFSQCAPGHRGVMDRAVGVLRNSKLGPPFRRWQDQVAIVIRLRFTAQKVARRLMHRSMSAAFEGWLNAIDQTYRLIYLANKVVKRMALLALGQAFTGWASATGQSTRTRTTVTRAVKRLKDRELTAAWDSWIAAHKKRLENQVAVQRTLAKMLNRALSAAFDAWNSFFRDKKRLRHLGQKCVKGFKAALQRSAFNTWGQATIAHMYALEPRYLLLAMRSPHDRRRFPTPHSGIFAQVESQVHIPLPSALEACKLRADS